MSHVELPKDHLILNALCDKRVLFSLLNQSHDTFQEEKSEQD